MNHVNIVTIESDLGAGTKGAKLGSVEILDIIHKKELKLSDAIRIDSNEFINNFDEENSSVYAKNIASITELQKKVILNIQNVLKQNCFPLIISGDHSSGAAIISAIKDFYQDKRIGVVWIDAHADLHTPFTTPSGNLHGMPLAICLGLSKNNNATNKPEKFVEEYWNMLLKLGSNKISPKILPQDLVLVGLRDFEEQEKHVIDALNIKVFTVEEVRKNCEEVAQKAMMHLDNCDLIFVSFDVDSLDPSSSSGTGTPVPNGLLYDEAKILLYNFLSNEKTVAFEITEVNPILDRINPMEHIAANLIIDLFK